MDVFFLKALLRKRFPFLLALYKGISEARSTTFDGWGMKTTSTLPPWYNESSSEWSLEVRHFLEVEKDLCLDIQDRKFIATQFSGEDMSFVLQSLRWRHYFVFMSCLLAAKRVKKAKNFNLVECGVCDGLTMRFSIGAVEFTNCREWNGYLYDSWEKMSSTGLTIREASMAGSYDHISLERTKLNLVSYSNKLIFNKGFIPDSFIHSSNPDVIHWLHIDLNASIPTLASLEFFQDRFESGAVILLDDYGWKSHLDTRKVADEFARKLNTFCIQLPTGQALILLH
jgi:hypothetical protein